MDWNGLEWIGMDWNGLDVVVGIDCDDIVDVVVDVAEMLLGLWEEWSFEKTWLTDWLTEWVKKWLLERLSPLKMGGKRTENNGGKSDNYDVASQSPNSNRLQRRCFCLFSYYGCDISKELYHLIIPFSDNAHDISNKPTGSVDCVWIIFFVFSIWAKHRVFLF